MTSEESTTGVYEFIGKINTNNSLYYATVEVNRIYVSPYGINHIQGNYMFVSNTSAYVLPVGDDSGVYKHTSHLVLNDTGCVLHFDKKPYSIEHYIKSGYECLMDKEQLDVDNLSAAIKFGDVVFEINIKDISRNSKDVKNMHLDNVMLLGEAIYTFLIKQSEIKDHITFMDECV
jgi:hypothetical protein